LLYRQDRLTAPLRFIQVSKPSNPTRTGYTFGGWFTDVGCTIPYDFKIKVTSDVTVYAKWTEKSNGKK